MNGNPYTNTRPAWLRKAMASYNQPKTKPPAKRGKQISDPQPAGKPGEF
jgi:hypothetical protein